jgi:Protein of unknown function (DUF3634)
LPLIVLFIALVGLLLVAVRFFVKPPAVFVVRIRQGAPQATRGKVTRSFLAEIAEFCRELGVKSGEIRGVPRGRLIALWFSGELPATFCQRLRNWWAISGWSARPGRR